jgi:ubiquinol-cytochrome c reductase cytochrome b subunit
MPGWEIRAFGFEIPNPFFPAVLLAGVTFMLLYAWPFLEARVTGDHREHHLCDRPRQRPVRTALGVATLSFYVICFAGGASDVLSSTFGLSVNAVLWTFRLALFVVPPAAAFLTYRLCCELAARDGLPIESRVSFREIPRRLFGRSGSAPRLGDQAGD